MSWSSIAAQTVSAEQRELLVQLISEQLNNLPLTVKRDRYLLEAEARPVV